MNELCGCQPKSRQSANMGGRKHGEPGRPEKNERRPPRKNHFRRLAHFSSSVFPFFLPEKFSSLLPFTPLRLLPLLFFRQVFLCCFFFGLVFFFVCLFCQLFFFQFLLGEWKRRTREVAPVYASFSRDKIRVVTMQKESKNHCELLRQLISTHV